MKIKYKILIGALIAFIFYNVIWGSFYIFKYRPFEKEIGVNEYGDYTHIDGDYCYGVEKPDYLGFTFNLAVTQVRKIEKKGEKRNGTYCDLLIWPSIFGNDEYGIQIVKYKDDQLAINGNYILDKNMQLVDPEKYDKEALNLLEENKETIQKLYNKAFMIWKNLNDE